tara:strand:- start:19 stop:591 length:573 start_codon:yes stop_codon:yes gene_type:complete
MIIGVWKAGGGEDLIDIEEAYSVCWDLAPQRFCWRTRTDLPNTKKLNKALSDLRAKEEYPLVRKGAHKVRLSAAGLKWVENHTKLIEDFSGAAPKSMRFSSNHSSRELERFRKTDVFREWMETPDMSPEKWELALALRCSLDSPVGIWQRRLETLGADAELYSDGEVTGFINFMLEKNSEWFGGRYDDLI